MPRHGVPPGRLLPQRMASEAGWKGEIPEIFGVCKSKLVFSDEPNTLSMWAPSARRQRPRARLALHRRVPIWAT